MDRTLAILLASFAGACVSVASGHNLYYGAAVILGLLSLGSFIKDVKGK
jgi:hypothetical protein